MNHKPGWATTEFWLVVGRLVAGVVLSWNEETRTMGSMLLGLSGADGYSYTQARTELKKKETP